MLFVSDRDGNMEVRMLLNERAKHRTADESGRAGDEDGGRHLELLSSKKNMDRWLVRVDDMRMLVEEAEEDQIGRAHV